ncbi:ATP-binding protein [Streptomyces roseolus]|uniref:ATP-binding protein n=1 Tax=Streptomyces roseolus TaxID=67358 RepID=UPI0036F7B4BC
MDPIHRGPDESGHDTAAEDARPAQSTALPDRAAAAPARARVTRIVSGGLLLTVNPVDGSEIEPCPPGETPPPARRRTPEERAEADRAAAAAVPPGPAAPELPLLEREEQRARLTETLTRGRSARLTGPDGAGRTALLDVVAADCADLAPDGVVRLSGHHRTGGELLHELRAAVLHAPGHRPDGDGLRADLATVGAVVVVDDLEFGGAALDELLAAAPECAFLLAAAPDAPAPSAEARIEEVALPGLGRAASLALLEAAVGRRLTEEEANWAGDLWFESEGLPLRFVQAGALLRQRDRLRVTPAEFDAFGALEEAFGPSGTAPGAGTGGTAPAPDPYENPDVELHEVPLPSLGEGAAPAALLASRLSRSAQTTLRFAVALGGELPHHAHLPALVGDTHADAALGELRACGLLSPVGSRHRLAGGVLTQLLAHGYGHDTADRLHTAAQHYAWWAGHPSVGPERAAAESDALLAALGGLLGDGAGTGEEAAERRATAVALARTSAPAFAAGLHWGAWERALRAGQEAARLAGDVAEEAYFHHELGVLAICGGNLARARAELEASIGLRGALADKRGTVAGRRALALVADLGREREPATAALPARTDSPARGLPVARPTATAPVPRTPVEPATEVLPPVATTAAVTPPAFPAFPGRADVTGKGPAVTAASPAARAEPARKGLKAVVLDGTRRNLAAVGAGALLVAVLGTVVTLGATSGNDDAPTSGTVSTDSTADAGVDELPDTGDGAPADGEPGGGPAATGTPTASGSPGPTSSGATPSPTATDPSATGSPSTSSSGTPAPSTTSAPGTTSPPTTTSGPTSTSPGPTRTTTTRPTFPTSSAPPPPTQTPTPTTAPPTTTSAPPEPTDTATTSQAAGSSSASEPPAGG